MAIDDSLSMTAFPPRSLDDLAGRKIAAPGLVLDWLTGAVGVLGSLTTYHDEIETDVYDGAIVFASAALPGKLHEVAPHVTRLGLGAQFAGALGANADWHAGLPPEVQAALAGAADASLADLEGAVAAALGTKEARGATITDAPEAMLRE